MREVKFRGKRVDNGEWVYGNLIHTISHCDNGMPEMYFEQWEEETYYIQPIMTIGNERAELIEVIPETIGQYTGLKEIYEGDIVEWNYRGINKAVVFWDSIKAGFFITPTHCYKWRMEEPSYIRAEFLNAKNKKVIGNIYENSDLLKD